jgi:3-oxoacyl-[acyl-carrier-protein] synthase-1
MSSLPIAIQRTGLVTSVGLSAPAACAAIRAKLKNPSETRFIDSAGEWIMAHQVPLEQSWRGLAKLGHMAAMAIEECLADVPRKEWSSIPLLLCVAERDRPGRVEGLDDRLFVDLQRALGIEFAVGSAIVAHGRVGMAIALMQARSLIHERKLRHVLVAATDSLLSWPTLSHYERNDRLLTARNSDGFMPGEGAGALLLAPPGGQPELLCTGIGFGVETAPIGSEEPLRADGLAMAIRFATDEASCQVHDLDFRIADVSGEQYYFKEAALALSRTLRQRKEAFDIWHPAECTGEAGALSGASQIALADAACRKAYAPGVNILAHMAGDAGQRAAAVLRFGVA